VSSELRDQLQEIYDRNGKLTPALVVEEARDHAHPLHSHFDWDDRTAGEAWRRQQAHTLIQSVRVTYAAPPGDGADQPGTVRYFHAIRGADSSGGYSYEPLGRITADPLMAEILLRDMEREWRHLKQRYENFAQFWQMVRSDLAA
jgi:hypothetical protein